MLRHERRVSGFGWNAKESTLHGHSCHRIQRNVANNAFRCAQELVSHGLVDRPETVLIGDLFEHSAS